MIVLALILTLLGAVIVVAWLAGRFVRTSTACNQNCRQGRDCSCCTREAKP